MELKRTDYILAKYVFRYLKKQGVAIKDELQEYISINCDEIPEGYVDFIKVSNKSGKEYRPFLFHFNFAIKYLEILDFINRENKKIYLTEKGSKLDFESYNFLSEFKKIEKGFAEKREKEMEEVSEINIDDREEVFENWKDE